MNKLHRTGQLVSKFILKIANLVLLIIFCTALNRRFSLNYKLEFAEIFNNNGLHIFLNENEKSNLNFCRMNEEDFLYFS